MGFIEEAQLADPFDLQCSRTLRDHVFTKIVKTARPYNELGWVQEFKLLRAKYPSQRIETALAWFILHYKEDKVPPIQSARSFRRHFRWLEDAMARGVAASPLELTHEVQALQNKLALLWPKKEKEVEAQFLQLSVNNFNEYVTKLKALLAKLREEAERRRRETKVYRSSDWANVNLVAHLLNQDYDAIHYVGWYAKEVHTIAWKWPNWRGNLMKWVWTVDCRLFTKHMQDRCASWNGDPDAWNEVKELLNG